VAVPMVRPTADTRLLASAALSGPRAIYREGFRYEKRASYPPKVEYRRAGRA